MSRHGMIFTLDAISPPFVMGRLIYIWTLNKLQRRNPENNISLTYKPLFPIVIQKLRRAHSSMTNNNKEA